MKANPVIMQRVVKSYELMLDFYGMRLVSRETGLLGRVLPPRNYEIRYRNLVSKWGGATAAGRSYTSAININLNGLLCPQLHLTTISVSRAC